MMGSRRILVWLAFLSFCIQTVSSLDVQAHRGGRDLFPENTLSAFRHALELGVNTLEMDVALTSDSVPVLSHDPYLSSKLVRGPDGEFLQRNERLLIVDLSREELRRYSVGEINPRDRYYYAHRNQQPVFGEKIPTLSDLFELVIAAGNSEVRFNIEIKSYPNHPEWTAPPGVMVDAVLRVIQRYGMADRVTIQSFDWRSLRIAKEHPGDIATVCLTSERINLERGNAGPSPWLDGLDVDDFADTVALVAAFDADMWSPDYRDIGRTDVVSAHDRALRVIPWTVNEPAAMRQLIEWGVDGIITDRPDLLIDQIEPSS